MRGVVAMAPVDQKRAAAARTRSEPSHAQSADLGRPGRPREASIGVAIYLEFESLFVRRTTIDEKYPGGFDAYWADCPGALVADDHLAQFGSMSSRDTAAIVDQLLVRARAFAKHDIAIATRDFTSQPWLAIGRLDGIPYGWLAGTEPTARHFWRTPEMMMAGDQCEPARQVAAGIGAVRPLGASTRSLVVRDDAGIEIDLWDDEPGIVTLSGCHERVAGFAPDDGLMRDLLAEFSRAGWLLPPRRLVER